MKVSESLRLVATALAVATLYARMNMTSLPVEDIDKVSSPPAGETKQGGALFFDLPRTDLKLLWFDVDLGPANGFDAEIGLRPIDGEARSLLANSFRFTAVHNRELFVGPQVLSARFPVAASNLAGKIY